jgi:deoxyribodipyrimidine photo-lyase
MAKTPQLSAAQKQDAIYARLAEQLIADPAIPQTLREFANDLRVTVRRRGPPALGGKCVVYWMQRSQRGKDNHAIDLAINVGNALGLPVVAYFAAVSNFPHANLRHYVFLNQGLPDVEEDLAARGIGFVMRRAPHCDHKTFFNDVKAAIVIGDENPMREPERWRVALAKSLDIPFWTVDADVIAPSKLLEKTQFSAGVVRPRLYRALPEFLIPFENPVAAHPWKQSRNLRADDVHANITRGWRNFDRSVTPVEAWHGGHHAAILRLNKFCGETLGNYDRERNHPETDGTSSLSPYLHFGHIGPLTIALSVDTTVKKHPHLKSARDSFFNELIVWRELSINFVRYQPAYDSPSCADPWARATIDERDRDEREVLYTLAQLEAGECRNSQQSPSQQDWEADRWRRVLARRSLRVASKPNLPWRDSAQGYLLPRPAQSNHQPCTLGQSANDARQQYAGRA